MPYTARETARIIHETFRAMQAVDNDDMPALPWMWEPRSVRNRTVAGVHRVWEQGLSAPGNHEQWCRDMISAGWVRGAEKDPEGDPPTHPDIVPWPELDPVKKMRAVMFVEQVRVLMGGR